MSIRAGLFEQSADSAPIDPNPVSSSKADEDLAAMITAEGYFWLCPIISAFVASHFSPSLTLSQAHTGRAAFCVMPDQ